MGSGFKILMYSHDTCGLGHLRRSLAVAEQLAAPDTAISILTGTAFPHGFALPGGTDLILMPGMAKKKDGTYQPRQTGRRVAEVIRMRSNMILSAVRTIAPDLFIVDKEPLGLMEEARPGLEWLRDSLPAAKAVLGMRDIMDEGWVIRQQWQRANIMVHLDRLYSEIWVYGSRRLYNPIREYAIPDRFKTKIHFTGYLARPGAARADIRRARQELARQGQSLVLVTPGGGCDGYKLLDTFLTWYAQERPANIRAIMVTGPYLPEEKLARLQKRGRALDMPVLDFSNQMDVLMGAADLVICMGGYNTLCEALSFATPCIAVPRQSPRKEQLIRARAMHGAGLMEYIPWPELCPGLLGEKIGQVLAEKKVYQQAMSDFNMPGIQTLCLRVGQLKAGRP